MAEMLQFRKRILSILIAFATATVTAACGCGTLMAASTSSTEMSPDHSCCGDSSPSQQSDGQTPIPEPCFHCQGTITTATANVTQIDQPLTTLSPALDPQRLMTFSRVERSADVRCDHVSPTGDASLLRQHCALNL